MVKKLQRPLIWCQLWDLEALNTFVFDRTPVQVTQQLVIHGVQKTEGGNVWDKVKSSVIELGGC